MRRILVDYSRGHDAKKRGVGVEKVFLDEAIGVAKQKGADVIALDEALTRRPRSILSKPIWWNGASSAA